MPAIAHGHKPFQVFLILVSTVLECFPEHRFKYDHGAVRKVTIHLKANVQRLILILVDDHSVHQHSEVSVGYSALGEYVIE